MDMNTIYDIEKYISDVNEYYVSNVATEHSYRAPLQNLLTQLLGGDKKRKVSIINEATRKDYGAPDIEFRRDDVAIAFIETKKIGDLDLLGQNSKQHKQQFDRYKNAVNLIAFTDYLRFYLYKNGEQVLSATIGRIENKEVVINDDEQQIGNFLKLVYELGNAEPQPIRSAKLLAEVMAGKAKVIASVLNTAMALNKTVEDEELHAKLEAFQKFLVHDMSVEQFSDFYAQTIVYGLFIARIYDKTPKTFSLQEAAELIPAINPFLKKIFKHLALAELHKGIKWIVDDLVAVFRVTDMRRVMHNYGKDPLVHFYEEFLEAYNPKLREDFGVWYTPQEVVSFIVDAVDAILREKLNTEKGLADNSLITYKDKSYHKVQILDPATGTGTFLAMVAEKIYKSYKGKEGCWPEDVVKDIIPRLNGFEYLMAPYTMAHLKVATALRLNDLQEDLPERLNIFLTNSLDKDYPEERLDFAKFITDESNAASRIKRDTPVMVVMGNPPYNEKSANNSDWIMGLMNDYKQEPGLQRKKIGEKKNKEGIYKNTLKERNSKGLNNDYCKFIRLGQNFMENTEEGVLAYICGNTFLDTTLFRGMRYELLKKFDEIYIINLHGSTKRSESTDDGKKDECVFNIQVGVSINIFIKRRDGDSNMLAGVYYKDLYGSQREKLQYLASHRLSDIDFQKLTPQAPLFTFRIRSNDLRQKYDSGFNIRELMTEDVKQGIKTGIDSLVIHYTKKDVGLFANKVATTPYSEMVELFHFANSEALSRKYSAIQKNISDNHFNPSEHITEITYRPFDNRWTIYGKETMDRPRPEIGKNVVNKRNMILCLGKEGSAIGDNEWSLTYISTLPTDINVIPRGGIYLFPLFIYNQKGDAHTNFSSAIISKIEERTGLRMLSATEEFSYVDPQEGCRVVYTDDEDTFLPLDLLDYIYAVLHSRRYRKTYHECLQDGFPTIPYPDNAEYFRQMAELGGRIRRLHQLQGITDQDFITTYSISRPKDNNLCTLRRFEETGDGQGRVWINEQQYFDHVPVEAWNMVVAGYQPLDRWLKDRKGKKLTNDEIEHYQKMIVALQQQIQVMKWIDGTIKI
jgi:predicted helicase